ncbi:MAG: hypothetical protein NUV69_03480 [Candidatus Curtissbacteria bacterium]|nr:hypothetical protein [Candidatus Curtissbacteria bacterium]
MIVENGFFSLDFLTGAFTIKAFAVLFLVFYSVFSLILYRQIQLMARSVQIQLASVLKAIAIVQIGVSIALIFIIIGAF